MDKELRKRIGKNLQLIRKAAGFKSAKSFAEHMGIEISRYTEYEQGRVGLSYETAWQLADALECSMDELGGRPWPPDEKDVDVSAVTARYAALPPFHRKAVRDMITVQENDLEKTEPIPGDSRRNIQSA